MASQNSLAAQRQRLDLTIISIALILLPSCFAFLDASTSRVGALGPSLQTRRTVGLDLVPLSTCSDGLSFFEEPESIRCCIDSNGNFDDETGVYELALVEKEDLPDISRFVVATFGADAIRLSNDMNAFEKMLMSPAAELMNGYSSLVAFAEVFSGTKQRLTYRFEKMDISKPQLEGLSRQEMIDKAEKDSLILALGKRIAGEEPRIDVIASIELRLQVRRVNDMYLSLFRK
jgi:hypothetical protein